MFTIQIPKEIVKEAINDIIQEYKHYFSLIEKRNSIFPQLKICLAMLELWHDLLYMYAKEDNEIITLLEDIDEIFLLNDSILN